MLLSREAFEAWLRDVPAFDAARVVHIEPVDGGVSNITCRVSLERAPADAVALRLQRERGIFEPYDVIREGEVLRCLAHSAVPVPTLLGSERDASVLGLPFIAMEWIDAPHMGNAPGADFAAFTAAVATIHAVDFRALGLGAVLGIPPSTRDALAGELEAVERRREHFPGANEPILTDAAAVLRRSIPCDGTLAFCQGDINVFNYLFRGRQVVGVVDWEQARISDARSDVGQLLALSLLKGAPLGPADEQPFVRAYAATARRPVQGMAWFRARWLWELGVIYHGWLSFSGSTPWYTHEALVRGLEAALDELEHG